MTTEDSKGMKDVGTSNVSHVSRKPLQCMQVKTPYAGHVVEVTFRNHYNAYDLNSNTTRLSSGLFNGGKIKLYSNKVIIHKNDVLISLSTLTEPLASGVWLHTRV